VDGILRGRGSFAVAFSHHYSVPMETTPLPATPSPSAGAKDGCRHERRASFAPAAQGMRAKPPQAAGPRDRGSRMRLRRRPTFPATTCRGPVPEPQAVERASSDAAVWTPPPSASIFAPVPGADADVEIAHPPLPPLGRSSVPLQDASIFAPVRKEAPRPMPEPHIGKWAPKGSSGGRSPFPGILQA
jgi:hypothetical protein